MNAYQPAQEYNDLRWGTMMPVPLMIGSRLVQVRARGLCSLTVQDTQRLQAQVPDPDNLTAHVRALLASAMTDVLGELSLEATDVAQLTAVTEQATRALQSKLEPKFSALGLQMKAVKIEAIESV